MAVNEGQDFEARKSTPRSSEGIIKAFWSEEKYPYFKP